MFAPAKIALAGLLAATAAAAFEVSFPNSNGGYWVVGTNNTLNWGANSTDPEYFSVALINTNTSVLNGNFQVANTLPTANGTAQIFLDITTAASGFTLLFVNSSNYELEHPQVYYTSPVFEIRTNGTQKPTVTPNPSAQQDPTVTGKSSSSSSGSATGSATSSSASTSATGKSDGAPTVMASFAGAAGVALAAAAFVF